MSFVTLFMYLLNVMPFQTLLLWLCGLLHGEAGDSLDAGIILISMSLIDQVFRQALLHPKRS